MNARSITLAGPSATQPSAWRTLVDRWTARLRERAELATMTARERKDAGITAYDVELECSKPFWRD